MKRIQGLDSIRFIAATWVFFYHLGFSETFNFGIRESIIEKLLGALIDCIFCGPAAVIIFFIISGFCIQYNYGNKKGSLPVVNFILRRCVRILLPVIGIVLCLGIIGAPDYSYIQSPVGWSVECELVYYALFPLLLLLSRCFGWNKLFLISFFGAFLLAYFLRSDSLHYPSFDLLKDSVLGLPCFIIGCKLATCFKDDVTSDEITLWIRRCMILLGSISCFSLMLHFEIGFAMTLNFFAILGFFWLLAELTNKSFLHSKILNWCGKWSYSLYLCHYPVMDCYIRYFIGEEGRLTFYHAIIIIFLSFIISYVFYLFIEKPSLLLSKSFRYIWSDKTLI